MSVNLLTCDIATCMESEIVNIGSDNGLLPVQYQAITWTSAGLLSIGPLPKLKGTNFICFFMEEYAFQNVICKTIITFKPKSVKKNLYCLSCLIICFSFEPVHCWWISFCNRCGWLHVNSSWPETIPVMSHLACKENRLTMHICITREIRTVFSDAYMQHQSKINSFIASQSICRWLSARLQYLHCLAMVILQSCTKPSMCSCYFKINTFYYSEFWS